MHLLSLVTLFGLAGVTFALSSEGEGLNQKRTFCDDGKYYNFLSRSCKDCPANTYANYGICLPCGAGSTSSKGSTTCTCSAGHYSSNGLTTWQACRSCSSGSYSSSSGSRSCSQCPANTFSSGGASSCKNCPTGHSCGAGSGSCGPQPSGITKSRRADTCSGEGKRNCPILSGSGGLECIDILATYDSCGGCVGPEGVYAEEFTGRDCSTIPNSDVVSCVQGKCQVDSCKTGYTALGDSCISVSHGRRSVTH